MMAAVRIQGVLVVVAGVGILIRGPSGAGKTLAALSLMARGHRFVADDLMEVSISPEGVPVGRPVEADVRIEVRGLGMFPARTLFPEGIVASATIDLVMDLDTYDPASDAGRVSPAMGSTTLMGRPVALVRAPVPTGFDPALLVELVARLFNEGALGVA